MVQGQRAELATLRACLAQATTDEPNWPVARRVDVRLIRSALARVRWKLDVNRRWKRDPGFYLGQAPDAGTRAVGGTAARRCRACKGAHGTPGLDDEVQLLDHAASRPSPL